MFKKGQKVKVVKADDKMDENYMGQILTIEKPYYGIGNQQLYEMAEGGRGWYEWQLSPINKNVWRGR